MSTPTMINTKKVKGRREVRYQSLDDFLADAEHFATANVQQLGNWSPGQIYEHLSRSMKSSIEGFPSSLPAPVRFLLSMFMKQRMLTKSIPSGFKSPSYFVANKISNEEGLASLRDTISRLKTDSTRAPHPGFGKISIEEWTQFHLRHAEMHMSFLKDAL